MYSRLFARSATSAMFASAAWKRRCGRTPCRVARLSSLARHAGAAVARLRTRDGGCGEIPSHSGSGHSEQPDEGLLRLEFRRVAVDEWEAMPKEKTRKSVSSNNLETKQICQSNAVRFGDALNSDVRIALFARVQPVETKKSGCCQPGGRIWKVPTNSNSVTV